MKDVLYRTREVLENNLCDTIKHEKMTTEDLDCVYKAVKTLAQIATIEAMERAKWTEEESRRMHDPYWEAESMRRGRNALGQYTSHYYDTGYSGHSINDRMIESLERSITPDMSDFEKQRVMEEIRQLRERKD